MPTLETVVQPCAGRLVSVRPLLHNLMVIAGFGWQSLDAAYYPVIALWKRKANEQVFYDKVVLSYEQ